MVARAYFEPLRSLASGDISSAYAEVGTPVEVMARLICFTNNTQGDVVFSYDDTIEQGQIFVASGSFKLFDVQSNMNVMKDDKYVLPEKLQWYVKQLEAPVSGSVYIEVLS